MKRLGTSILLALLVLLMITTPVYADTPNPDSDPQIESLNIYRNLREVDDMLVLIYATIPYATIPDTPVTQTYTWRLMDTDNATELGSTVGYAYNVGTHLDDGFNYNVWSMYFSADNVTNLGIVWGTSYPLRLSGNPAVFDAPPIYNFTINYINYTTSTLRADVQAELATQILDTAADLDKQWGLSTDYSLLTQEETGTVLSTYGSAFFRGVIPGVQALAPTVFSVVIRAIDIPARDWDPEYSENVTSQWAGTWVETSKEAGKALFGTDYDLLSIIILSIGCVGLLIGNIMLTGDHWNGLVDVSIVCVIGARLGMFDLAFLILIAALCWIYIGMKIWFGLIK